MEKEHPKHLIYTALIMEKVAELFDEELTEDELMQGDNLTHFMHALGNLAPNLLYKTISNNKIDNLEFNQLMNRLVFQFSKVSKEVKEV